MKEINGHKVVACPYQCGACPYWVSDGESGFLYCYEDEKPNVCVFEKEGEGIREDVEENEKLINEVDERLDAVEETLGKLVKNQVIDEDDYLYKILELMRHELSSTRECIYL
ncbi:MAG: hypothetical protein IJ899_02960 [Blautia sp.]|nr:hypothetical protein [Blautia sp.]